ncbi:phosphoribosyltransferase [Fulvivirgaceae bacterium PWU20]|uniref:Phosphoribosyltransferase n=2 Tax=Chryseosolibacter indicus TaxID=2782351 RepID=A0ABS5VMH0_9BACT|nr:phosphoribosyltransferase family protein [Chryseosolibacter indicus]MBT1702044.1 phosphoribosyltransferase [Chryseosolibacter indicus]
MVMEKSLILDAPQIKQKIRRMAFEIYEHNFKERSIVIAGIAGQGYVLAKLLAKEVEAISEIKIVLVQVWVDKEAPQQSDVKLDCELKELKKKCIILVDDVLNTGRTFAYGLKPFLNIAVKKIEIAVLVNRSHTLFPIYPQYTGYELATTLTEHVEVVLGKGSAVYLK